MQMTVNLLVCVAMCSAPLLAGWDAIGPFGGSAAVIQVDRQHGSTVLAATSNALVFRSDDGGNSWRVLPFPAQLRATLHAFVLDPQNRGVYLAGLSSDMPEYSGILHSGDGGLTWKRFAEVELKGVWSIAIWPRDSRVIAAGTEDGVFLTRDAGENWTRISPRENRDLKPVVSLAFDPVDSKILYAGTPHLPWKTVDGGATWRRIHTGMADDSDVFSIQVDQNHPQRLFASACSGIYRSSNAGASWTKLIGAQGASYRTYQITQHPVRPNVLFAGTTLGLAKSTDGGISWRRLSHQSTRWIAFDPDRAGRIFVATDEEGLFRSDDLGESLHPVNRGFCNRRLGSLAASGGILFVNSIQNSTSLPSFQTDNAGQTWKPADLAVSALGARSLLKTDPRVPGAIAPSTFVYGLVATNHNGILAATSRGLMKWYEDGTWQPLTGVLGASTVTAICKHPTHAGVIFASKFGVIYVSKDEGLSWTRLTSENDRVETITELLIVPEIPDRMFALTRSHGVYAISLAASQ